MWIILLTITLCSVTKIYCTVYALQTNHNYTHSFEYHNLHIFLSVASCSWYEFHSKMLKHTAEPETAVQFKWVFCLNITYVFEETHANIRAWTCKCDLYISASLLLNRFFCWGMWMAKWSRVFTSVLPWDLFTHLREVININLCFSSN
jgi:hypothetical protein